MIKRSGKRRSKKFFSLRTPRRQRLRRWLKKITRRDGKQIVSEALESL